MASAPQLGLIAALIGVAIIAGVVSITDQRPELAKTEVVAASAEYLDPYGNPSYASLEEARASGNCDLGIEPLYPPTTPERFMCSAEMDAPETEAEFRQLVGLGTDVSWGETREEAIASGDCGNTEVTGERLVLPSGMGFTCEVERGDPVE